MSRMHAYYIIKLCSRWFYVLYLCIHFPGSHGQHVTPAYVAIGGSREQVHSLVIALRMIPYITSCKHTLAPCNRVHPFSPGCHHLGVQWCGCCHQMPAPLLADLMTCGGWYKGISKVERGDSILCHPYPLSSSYI